AGEQLAIVVAVGEPARRECADDVHRPEERDRARRGHLGEAVLDRVRDEVPSDEAVRGVAANEEARREEPEIAGPRGLAKRRRPLILGPAGRRDHWRLAERARAG